MHIEIKITIKIIKQLYEQLEILILNCTKTDADNYN
jgi:hypothetical protein